MSDSVEKAPQSQMQEPSHPITIFYSYAPADETLQRELEKHLSGLRRKGIIQEWHHHKIEAGKSIEEEVNVHLLSSSIILLLISPDFLASDYCHSVKQKALELYKTRNITVIPILLRPADWQHEDFASLQYLPRNGRPVTTYSNRDTALRDIAKEIRTIIQKQPSPETQDSSANSTDQPISLDKPYISNLNEKNKNRDFFPRSKDRYRRDILKQVYAEWITKRLAQSLSDKPHIVLELNELSGMTASRWQHELYEEVSPAPQPQPATNILQIYDRSGHELLILGAPGSGKTTLIRELTRDLLYRAAEDDTHPIPIVLNLVSWTTQYQSLNDWLVKQLTDRYGLKLSLSHSWIENDNILLLLDGLDEVPFSYQADCIKAINTFRQEHSIVPIVVCSRYADYQLHNETQLLLRTAVMIQPLTKQLIDEYFSKTNLDAEKVRQALYADTILLEMATTPLMLDILIRTYHNQSIEDLLQKNTLYERRQQVFATYIQGMLNRRAKQPHYKPEQVIRCLSLLAQSMTEWSTEEFHLERMQPDVLHSADLYSYYRRTVLIVVSIIFISILGLPIIPLLSQANPIPIWLTLALAASGGVIVFNNSYIRVSVATERGELAAERMARNHRHYSYRLMSGTIERNASQNTLQKDTYPLEIEPAEKIIWSWRTALNQLQSIWSLSSWRKVYTLQLRILTKQHSRMAKVLAISAILLPWILSIAISGLTLGLETIPIVLSLLVLGVVVSGFSYREKKQHSSAKPSYAMALTAWNGILFSTVAFLTAEGLMALFLWQYSKLSQIQNIALKFLVFGVFAHRQAISVPSVFSPFCLFIVLLIVLPLGLRYGYFTSIQRLVLRFVLWKKCSIPWNLSRVLDYASERMLLSKVGGGYVFFHQLLLEYFASVKADTPHATFYYLHTLALAYCQQSQFDKALPLLQQALHLEDQATEPDKDHQRLLMGELIGVMDNLILIHHLSGQHEQALPFLEASLTLCERMHGPSSRNVIDRQHKLANLYYDLGRYTEAEQFLQRLIAACTSTAGTSSKDTIRHQSELAKLYYNLGRFAETEQLLQHLTTTYTAKDGIRKNTLETYASLLRKNGQTSEAGQMEAEIKEIEEILEQKHSAWYEDFEARLPSFETHMEEFWQKKEENIEQQAQRIIKIFSDIKKQAQRLLKITTK